MKEGWEGGEGHREERKKGRKGKVWRPAASASPGNLLAMQIL